MLLLFEELVGHIILGAFDRRGDFDHAGLSFGTAFLRDCYLRRVKSAPPHDAANEDFGLSGL